MDVTLQRAGELRQQLTDFVLDAEGELAIALESFSAAQLSRSPNSSLSSNDLLVAQFLVEGRVDGRSPLDYFQAEQVELSEGDREILAQWGKGFIGLFAVVQMLEGGFELMNWTTAKHYRVRSAETVLLEKMSRLKEGDILLTQIVPLPGDKWMVASPWIFLGKLGKPKLAVAIGNFKQTYKPYLYSDAPELLAEAWRSVERYHQEFIEFFGTNQVTLPGYQFSKRLAEFQEWLTQKRLTASGIDPSKSLQELATEAGVSQEETLAIAEAMGADAKTASALLNNTSQSQMVAPPIELPPHLKKAEQVTLFSHPTWGQLFLPHYAPLERMLQAEDWRSVPQSEKILRQSLADAEMNSFIWRQFADAYPTDLERMLQDFLERPEFRLQTDFDALMQKFNKPLEPELPETASVPLHLHELFQDAVLEVSKNNAKGKTTKQKSASGFKR